MSIVRDNLMAQKGYAPYCGNDSCITMPRAIWNGKQFACPHCAWVSSLPEDFIKEYKDKWGI